MIVQIDEEVAVFIKALREPELIVALERSQGADSDVSRVLPSDAFQTLFSHGLSFSEHDRERMAVMTERYLALAATVPTYRPTTTGLNHLDALIDRIEGELAE